MEIIWVVKKIESLNIILFLTLKFLRILKTIPFYEWQHSSFLNPDKVAAKASVTTQDSVVVKIAGKNSSNFQQAR